jgi:hypothetical protein
MSAGKRFEYEVRKSLEGQLNGWTQRIPDKMYGSKMSHKTPADLLCITSGLDMLIECKSTSIKKAKSIRFDRVPDHQFEALTTFDNLSDRHAGLLALHFYNGERSKASRVHRAWLVPISWWTAKLRASHKASININEIAVSKGCMEMTWAKPDGMGKNGWVLPTQLRELCARSAPASTSPTPQAEATASAVGHHIDVEWLKLPPSSEQ